MVHDQVDLLGQLVIQFGDDRLDRFDDVGIDELGLGKRLLREGLDGPADFFRASSDLGLNSFW